VGQYHISLPSIQGPSNDESSNEQEKKGTSSTQRHGLVINILQSKNAENDQTKHTHLNETLESKHFYFFGVWHCDIDE
jgi:transcription initiation factor TFIID subunit TAF12